MNKENSIKLQIYSYIPTEVCNLKDWKNSVEAMAASGIGALAWESKFWCLIGTFNFLSYISSKCETKLTHNIWNYTFSTLWTNCRTGNILHKNKHNKNYTIEVVTLENEEMKENRQFSPSQSTKYNLMDHMPEINNKEFQVKTFTFNS